MSERTCKVDDCDAKHYGKDFCHPHYTRWRDFGEEDPRLRGEVRNGCKICTACGEDKPLSEYGIDRSVKSGLAIYCKPCNRAKSSMPPPDVKRDAWNRTRARKAGVEVGSVMASHVLDRDGWICQICKEPIDASDVYPHPRSPSLDHVVPISRGGGHTPDNCQAAHLGCNSRKKNKILPGTA